MVEVERIAVQVITEAHAASLQPRSLSLRPLRLHLPNKLFQPHKFDTIPMEKQKESKVGFGVIEKRMAFIRKSDSSGAERKGKGVPSFSKASVSLYPTKILEIF
ncbi:hypothetical protein V6N13_020380 [Hibiscus sabdariffa]|uniref:Uncharacterized protein n=1 Tax=Hibiscus sabdariffa TaxID=183260 RepID=A0ABR2ETB1_9ROSI